MHSRLRTSVSKHVKQWSEQLTQARSKHTRARVPLQLKEVLWTWGESIQCQPLGGECSVQQLDRVSCAVQDVHNLGSAGQQVTVRQGFARNLLVPCSLAGIQRQPPIGSPPLSKSPEPLSQDRNSALSTVVQQLAGATVVRLFGAQDL